MDHVSTIILGTLSPQSEVEGDRRVTNAMAILERGFPDGILALCLKCHNGQEYGLDEAAVMIVDGTWPRCCDGKRVEMLDPENGPHY